MNTNKIPVVTVDGPGGAGKGTISLMLAKKLKWHFLDSGAIYRVLAQAAINRNIDVKDELSLSKLASELNVEFKTSGNCQDGQDGFDSELIILDGKDVTKKIRTETCGKAASEISVLPKVREALLQRQRDFSKLPGLVADGRDMGTIVFPDAKIKIFLDASPEVRAKRRYLQLKESNPSVNLQSLLHEIAERDERDRNRAAAPLKPANDAIIIDTTELDIDAVFYRVWYEVESRMGNLN